MIYAFRCKECSLLRVTAEGLVCDECLTNMADEDNASAESSIAGAFNTVLNDAFKNIIQVNIAPTAQNPLCLPPNYPLDAGYCGIVFSAPCLVHSIECISDGVISVYDYDTYLPPPSTKNLALTSSSIAGNTFHVGTYPWSSLKKGLYALITSGSFRIIFSDGNVRYCVPYT